MLAGAGFVAFFLAERVLVLHHRDDPDQARAHHQVGTLGALGLSAHSFVDGLGIGLAFGLDTATGVLVFIAVISHDFADGLNTVSFVLSQSEDRRKAKRWLAIDAVAPLVGATWAPRSASRRRPSARCSPSTPASSSTWAAPTCSRRPIPSTRPGRGSR